MSENNSNIDFGEVMRFAKSLSQDQDQLITPGYSPMDKLINNQELRIMKAALPYFDYPNQRNFAIFIKLLEFRKTMEVFQPSPPVHSELLTKKKLNRMELLKDIKNSCDEPQQKKINMLIKIMNLQSVMENSKSNSLMLENEEKNEPVFKEQEENHEDGYSEFMSMVHKIIDEKEGE